MAYTTENVYSTLNGNPPSAGQSTYSFTFPYIEREDVKVSLNGTTLATTAYSFANDTTIQLDSTTAGTVTTTTKVRIFRDTSLDGLNAEFFSGSAIRATDLNDNFNQTLFVTQEVSDRFVDVNNAAFSNDISMAGNKITNLGPGVAGTDAVNKDQLDASQNFNSTQLTSAVTNATTQATASATSATASAASATSALGYANQAAASATAAGNSATASATSATAAAASASLAATFSAETIFYGFKRDANAMLELYYSNPQSSTVYPVKDYEYKGGSQWIIGNDDLLYSSGANVGKPKFFFNSNGHLILEAI